MRNVIVTALAALSTVTASMAQAQSARPVAEVTNTSEPVLCAEKDNVTLNLASPEIRSLRIEATHPAYIEALTRDSFEADWTACDMSGDPVHRSDVKAPVRRTLYEEPALWVVGWTMPTYWRPATANVRIGKEVTSGLHLIQIWMIRPMGGEEVLVLYPQDGYWRARPLAPANRAPTAFGSSFLIGPIEIAGRPIVALKEIVFEPSTRTFTIAFERGGSATVRMADVDGNRHTLDVTFDKPVAGRPFAALRSMFITDFNNDVARVAVREAGNKGWREDPVMTFKGGRVLDLWAGRTTVSRHNSSSPDMVFRNFSASPAPLPKAAGER